MTDAAFDSWMKRARSTPIERVIAQRGIPLNGKTDRNGPCPICGGTDRFSINNAKGVWNCRQCGVGGDVIKLVQHLDGIDFIAACTTLAGEPPPKTVKPNGKHNISTKPKKVVTAKFPYHNESGAPVFVVERIEYQNADGTFIHTKEGKRKKSFRQKRPDPDRPDAWIWNTEGVPVVLYRLPEVLEAIALRKTILIAEGERKADQLWSWNVPATCCAGGAMKWRVEHSKHLRGADIVLVPDNDDAGWEHIHQVGTALNGIAARIRVLALPDLPPKGDIINWVNNGGTREQLDALVEQARDWQPPPEAPTDKSKDKAKAAEDEQQLIDELARLDALDYDKRRNKAAEEMGIRRSTLDDAVGARRAERAERAEQPPLFGYWNVEPWPEPVDTLGLLLSLVERIKQHLILGADAALTVALWVLFAWVHDAAAVHSPILLATSAEANSGKTTLLSLIGFLVPRALLCVEISEATLFRSIEMWQPSIIVDEADVILINNEALRARSSIQDGRVAPASRAVWATIISRTLFRRSVPRRSV
jgi:hypothetical protein